MEVARDAVAGRRRPQRGFRADGRARAAVARASCVLRAHGDSRRPARIHDPLQLGDDVRKDGRLPAPLRVGKADAARDTLSGIRLVAGVVALWCATAPAFACAQTPLTFQVRADNDVFNFWQPPPKRPDEEYTSGVRAALEYSG